MNNYGCPSILLGLDLEHADVTARIALAHDRALAAWGARDPGDEDCVLAAGDSSVRPSREYPAAADLLGTTILRPIGPKYRRSYFADKRVSLLP